MTRDPHDIAAAYVERGTGPTWPIDESVLKSPGIAARNRSAGMIASMRLEAAAQLNGSLAPSDMATLVAQATSHLLDTPLAGIGIELGAGLGVLSATIARSQSVDAILAVEICQNFVERVIPRVAETVLADRARRVVPVLGSFDRLELDDASVDFACEIDSLHHADDLHAVLIECARVLKPGSPLVCFDRAQPDEMPTWLRERMLDRVYTHEWIEANGYPPGIVMSRRENGEHEIRFREWRDAFEAANFELRRVVNFVPTVSTKMALKSLVARAPRPVRERLVALPPPRDYLQAWALGTFSRRSAVGSVVFAPKTTTGFLAYRRPGSGA